ncbi:all trans-polyprenyl-diphosphate synthase PDSS2-like isoform X1 [Cydia pomonella]|uniref:all trans-polyprenyl-diphosphate synthase PDSS2-like isoform X1 n=1 Tax=Cydia pomonella TaxID=82600 RepID=UPI002ADE1791|nr:all trans-polyprenyl-diphosphate synthase PDSS2-like isoform X1 [Cydia pomonella]XP_061722100.1 all trans-polyprenyl-diphosphate synthase PDSS2-like isoform X1 [Cydia pomonella]XP_061722101.1 all trans-polyprenyl-diphosphate synthase PDSS2-like isoform X1 [Cydia pomonella]XP_061722102.1 all trans-polyprenyl-diphosphate synthase PDSS2-like isoform X1 [Cydia pomonella]
MSKFCWKALKNNKYHKNNLMFKRNFHALLNDEIVKDSTCAWMCRRRGYSKHEPLDWREAIAQAEQTVGFPTSFLNLRWLFNDEIASTAIHLRKLVGTNHPLLKSAKNLLIGSKSNLQSVGLIILLVSKAAGLNTRDYTEDQYDSGILHSQRALAEIVEMKRTGHMIHKTMANLQEKEKFGDKFQDLLCGNKIVLLSGDYLLAKCLQHLGGLRNNEVTELISTGLRDLVEGDFLGERGPDNTPMPTKPKAENIVEPYDWENEYNLEKLGSNSYLGQGKEEWVLRTMLQSGSILGKGCQGAMKLARRGEEMERNAYILGGHLALMWQLYLDIKDFFIHPHSYSLVGAPIIMALWEYPSIYGHVWISKVERKPIEMKQLHYAVRSTRSMDYLTGLLDEELAAILKYSDRFPVEDAREALQNMARTIHGETLQYMDN